MYQPRIDLRPSPKKPAEAIAFDCRLDLDEKRLYVWGLSIPVGFKRWRVLRFDKQRVKIPPWPADFYYSPDGIVLEVL